MSLAIQEGRPGSSYCIGGESEKTNIQIVRAICQIMDEESPQNYSYENLITFVKDRPGHDQRYAIDPSKIINELRWKPKYSFEQALKITVRWYLSNMNWCNKLKSKSNYSRKCLLKK